MTQIRLSSIQIVLMMHHFKILPITTQPKTVKYLFFEQYFQQYDV